MNKCEKTEKRKRSYGKAEQLSLWLLVIPGMLILVVFNYLPMAGLPIAFKDFNPNLGIFGSPWNGLENFRFFFESSDAGKIIRNTVLYNSAFLVVDLVAALVLALLFYNLRSRRALKFYNTVVILPKFMSAVIISYIVYVLLNPLSGVVNQVIKAFGGTGVQWYMKAKYWPAILTITHIWQTVGINSIIYYAALMGLDETLMEAAQLDGANKWQQAWHVVIPHLIPVMVVTTILSMGNMFTGDFGLFYQTPMNIGTLYSTTDVVSTYTYRALQSGYLEKSAAVGLFQSVMGFITVTVTDLVVRKVSPENSIF